MSKNAADDRDQDPRDRIANQARITNFDDDKELAKLAAKFKEYIESSADNYETCIAYFAQNWPAPTSYNAAENVAQEFYQKTGYPLLRWLMDEHPNLFLDMGGTDQHFLEHALNRGNTFFVDCLVHMSQEHSFDIGDILSTLFADQQNGLHVAIAKQMSCSVAMVSRCSKEALLQRNNDNNLPLHLAMKISGRKASPTLKLSRRRKAPYQPNTSSRRSTFADYGDGGLKSSSLISVDGPGLGRDNEASFFDP
ncbi:hypothetical protein EDB80DRAFT_881442 [Ilyonectria destructans]|nr:hypothetical protein EDB80DRAFT_881442 [Ilyonectria destructans]